ncbi:Uu.00g079070.m01.CDS01 [Anthostomella pinea]|uniref:ribonuclease H n=1 Tax=Anthostomella pinea TaxID=933095 RepID=A0AAI8YJ31_9PEZI|nr:Uu.00g079070.m01.CDS01 [Anthostomella pinea]
MARRFSPAELVGRALDADETIEVGLGPWTQCLVDGSGFNAFNHIMVAIDGACRNNGRADARASLGVYFGKDNSRWNKSEILPAREATSQRAELCAALRALHLVDSYVARERNRSVTDGRTLEKLVIKSDSDYLVQAMTEWIFTWSENDYRDASGSPVQNADLFRRILTLVGKLDQERKLKVLFWKVPRDENMDADRLANAALDTAAASTWDYLAPDDRESEEYDSKRVWRWHMRMAHVKLRTLRMAIRSGTGIDVTEEQVQREIDKGASCPTCVRMGNGPDGIDFD